MKLGIVGSGAIVSGLLEFIDELDIEKVAICATERSRQKMTVMAKEHHIGRVYTDYDQFLQDGGFDVVYLGIPNSLHYSFGMKALEHDKDVIMEKPFCSNYRQAEKLIELARARKRIVLEAITVIHNGNFEQIRKLIPQLGDIKIVTVNYSQYSSRYPDFKKGIIRPAFDVNCSGGALMDLNVYNIHFIVGLFGMPEKVSYLANIEREIDTSGILTMDYGNFKAVAIAGKDCRFPSVNGIEGNRGIIYTNSKANTLEDFFWQQYGQETLHYNLSGGKNRMLPEFEDFLEIINNRDYEKTEQLYQQTLDVMKVLTMARESAGIVFPDDQVL